MKKYKSKFEEASKNIASKLLKDEDVIDAIMDAIEDLEPDFVNVVLNDGQREKLVKMIFSNKYQFFFISGDFDDKKDLNKLEKHKNMYKTFNHGDNIDQFSSIFYK